MITIYTSSSASSCRQAKAWLTDHDLEFNEINLKSYTFTETEIRDLFELSMSGTQELIATNSRSFAKLKNQFEDLSLSQLCKIITKDTSLLRLPILTENDKLMTGFNREAIRVFLPAKQDNVLERVRELYGI